MISTPSGYGVGWIGISDFGQGRQSALDDLLAPNSAHVVMTTARVRTLSDWSEDNLGGVLMRGSVFFSSARHLFQKNSPHSHRNRRNTFPLRLSSMSTKTRGLVAHLGQHGSLSPAFAPKRAFGSMRSIDCVLAACAPGRQG